MIGPFEPGYEDKIREKYKTYLDSNKLYVKNTLLSVKLQNTVVNAADVLIPNADFAKLKVIGLVVIHKIPYDFYAKK